MPRQDRRLIESKRVLHVGAAGQQLCRSFDKLFQYLADITHDFVQVGLRVQIFALKAEAAEKCIDEFAFIKTRFG